MKVVIDTNLLVASFFNKNSSAHKILEKAGRGEIEILWSSPIKKEARLILGKISRSVNRPVENLSEEIFPKEQEVLNLPSVDVIKEDPDDNKFLACALKGKADIIVSNDQHLLTVKKFKGIPILTSKKALTKISNYEN